MKNEIKNNTTKFNQTGECLPPFKGAQGDFVANISTQKLERSTIFLKHSRFGKYFFLLITIILTINSCSTLKKNKKQKVENNEIVNTVNTPNTTINAIDTTKKVVTKEFIKGNWASEKCEGCYSGDRTYYTFKDSTFTSLFYSYTDVVENDNCEIFRFYSTGTYHIEGKFLYLKGHYTDNTYKKENKDKCGKNGSYESEVEIYKKDSILYLGFQYRVKYPVRYWKKMLKN